MATRLSWSTSTLRSSLMILFKKKFLKKGKPFSAFLLLLTSCGSYPKKVNEWGWNGLKITGHTVICHWWWGWGITGWTLRCGCSGMWETIRVLVVWLLHCHYIWRVLLRIDTRNVGFIIWTIPSPGLAEHAHRVTAFGTCKKHNQSKKMTITSS